ncbi:hypothetical protein M1349_04520 [Patescibacteria group bacterium]|nr:hypothetical protein [Patescibacteria group bacterium]
MEKDRNRDLNKTDLLKAISCEVRKGVFETILNAESGHLGGSSSSVELLVCLYFGGYLKFDVNNPNNPDRDRVLIRGHEGPLRYKIFTMMDLFDEKHLHTYRQLDSILQGHEEMKTTPGVDITPSGSLGMLLSYGVGSAIEGKRSGKPYKTYVFLGDGEEQEGNVAEAARHAGTLGLNNLIVVIDSNKKQLSRPTKDCDGRSDLKKIWEGYGWQVKEIADGHDVKEIMSTYAQLKYIAKPTAVIAHTIKGKELRGAEENYCGYHTLSVCNSSIVQEAIERQERLLADSGFTKVYLKTTAPSLVIKPDAEQSSLHNENGELSVAISPNCLNNLNLDNSQEHYFLEFKKIVEESRIPFYVITPDFIRKDLAELVKFSEFSSYIDAGLREQHVIAMAHGISITNPKARIFINYGDAFVYRSADQINAASQGGSRMIIACEYSGLCQDKNGKTHQSSGQPGAMLTMPGVHVLEPADVQDMYNVFNWAFSENPGVVYARLHRKNIQPLYREEKDKENIKSYITHDPDKKPKLVIVSSGFLTENAVKAARILESKHNMPTRVINVIDLKNLDDSFVTQLEEDIPVLTVYNGNPKIMQSFVSAAVMESSSAKPSYVRGHGFEYGTSGKLTDLEKRYKMDPEGLIGVISQKFSQKEI